MAKDNWGRDKVYEVVDRIPKGFMVWNIGDNMEFDGYLPLCEWTNPEDKNNYNINRDTLKAIKLDNDSLKILKKAAGFGINNLENTKKRIAEGVYVFGGIERDLANKALPIFEKISE